MFVSDSIPASFNKIAEFNNNFIVLVENDTLSSGVDYEAYVQYFYPSLQVIHLQDYRIKIGDSYSLDHNSSSSGDLLSSDLTFSLHTSDLLSTEHNLDSRPDYPTILWTQFLLVFLFVWVLNQCSKFFKKGGVFTS